ncbi:protein translocase subunit SecF [Candidatus Woesearchaeota archaeon]|nr:protein translocase subunit SecF [Candidatus Woesearchaeota archaeon]
MALSRRERREQRRKLLKEQRLEQLRGFEEKEKQFEAKKKYKGLLGFYDKQYKKLLFIPFIILLIAIISIVVHAGITGDFINRGVSLKGGIVITVPVAEPVSVDEIEALLASSFPADDIDVRSIAEFGEQKAIIISSDNLGLEKNVLEALEEKLPDAKENASTETTGPSLGAGFFKQTMIALVIAFVFMGIVIFLYFRTFIPSMAAILAVFSDIVVTLAIVNLLGIKLSTAGIAAFLMLIGYSVDTDILLSTRVLKRKEGTVFQRILSAAKTGLTMNATTLVAVIIALILSQSEIIRQIMIILLIGLLVDVINTWLQNTGLLRYYLEYKKKRPAKAQAAGVSEE